MILKHYIGDKAFYKKALLIAVPIALQNGITQFVNMLDNLMIGQIGTEQMSGVSIVNQLISVFNLCVFGLLSGAGIFTAQYFGKKDHDGVRYTFRFKIMGGILLAVGAIFLFLFAQEPLINLFLHDSDSSGDVLATLQYGKEYLMIMLIGLVPFAIGQSYCSTLRETGQTVVPMTAGIMAVFVNMIFNYILIFGKFGFPALGVSGAAIATVLSRFAEMGFIMFWTHRHALDNPFILGAYRSMRIPGNVVSSIMTKGAPLCINEFFWSTGMAFLTQCYSVRGLATIAALNISNVVFQVFNTVFVAMGNAIAIIIGQLLGAEKMEEAKDTVRKLLFFSTVSCILVGGLLVILAPYFPMLYNTSGEVMELAAQFIIVCAVTMPMHAYLHGAYFTVRAGGKTLITFLFDGGFLWIFQAPVAFFLSRFTGLPIVPIYLVTELCNLIKCAAGWYLIRKGVWLHKIVN